jgi:hypothetical protein
MTVYVNEIPDHVVAAASRAFAEYEDERHGMPHAIRAALAALMDDETVRVEVCDHMQMGDLDFAVASVSPSDVLAAVLKRGQA